MIRALKLTRNQFSSFIDSPETIKQFEDLFRIVNELVDTAEKVVSISQVETPSTGFSIDVGNGTTIPYDNNVALVLDISGTLASGTIVFPKVDELREGQLIYINSTDQITSLTIDIQDASAIYGAITTILAGGFATFRYEETTNSWFRVA